MILVLEDDKTRQKFFRSKIPSCEMSSNATNCIKTIQNYDDTIGVLFLDHDLGGEMYVNSGREDCGMEVVRWICKNQPPIKQIIIHSHNPIAAKEMMLKLQDFDYKVIQIPFIQLKDQLEGFTE